MYIICHYAEIALKGKNRKFFEEKLVENIKLALGPTFFKSVYPVKLPPALFNRVKRISGRIIVELINTTLQKKQFQEIKERLTNVFGLSHFSFAENCKQEIKEIQKKALEILNKILRNKKGAFYCDRRETHLTFKIETQRSKKDFYLTSPQINEKVGEYVLKNLKLKVKLKNPDITCYIEIVEKYAFLYLEKIPCLGGLPVGVSGKAISLISGGIDSPVASFLMMKRGIKIIFLHFVITKSSIKKVKKLVQVLTKFQFQSKLYLIPFEQIQKEILEKGEEKLRCLLCKRAMLRIAENIAKKENVKTLITGENIGQVASQTLENIKVIENKSNLLILRPVAGLDKKEIIDLAKKIKTFEISISSEESCPIVPKHPETKAKLEEIEKAEKNVKIRTLVAPLLRTLIFTAMP